MLTAEGANSCYDLWRSGSSPGLVWLWPKSFCGEIQENHGGALLGLDIRISSQSLLIDCFTNVNRLFSRSTCNFTGNCQVTTMPGSRGCVWTLSYRIFSLVLLILGLVFESVYFLNLGWWGADGCWTMETMRNRWEISVNNDVFPLCELQQTTKGDYAFRIIYLQCLNTETDSIRLLFFISGLGWCRHPSRFTSRNSILEYTTRYGLDMLESIGAAPSCYLTLMRLRSSKVSLGRIEPDKQFLFVGYSYCHVVG